MKNCFICLEKIEKVPLLKCGCFICPGCYCNLKSRRIDKCSVCNKKMTRGSKKNI